MKKYYVYCLINEKKVTYVGSTTNPIKRLKDHKRDKNFKGATILELTSEYEMLNFEAWCIKRFDCQLNKNRPEVQFEPDLSNVKWKNVDTRFLYPERVERYHYFHDYVRGIYRTKCAEFLKTTESFLYCVEQIRDCTFEITSEGFLILKHDGSGLSFSELMKSIGFYSFADFEQRLRVYNGVISEEEYYKSLDQFK